MRDQVDSSDFQDRDHFLRRTFAWRFERPEQLAALLQLGEIVEEWIDETHQYGPDGDREVKDEEFRAAAEDLLLIAAYLRNRAEERFSCGFAEPIARRCERAERWSELAEALGRQILEDIADDETQEGAPQ